MKQLNMYVCICVGSLFSSESEKIFFTELLTFQLDCSLRVLPYVENTQLFFCENNVEPSLWIRLQQAPKACFLIAENRVETIEVLGRQVWLISYKSVKSHSKRCFILNLPRRYNYTYIKKLLMLFMT
jgi:hypothetical protein